MKNAKKPSKQIPLFDTGVEVRERDLDTEADRKERYRLAQAAKKADEARHLRWVKHNADGFNRRLCPCNAKECVAKRRK